MLGSPFAWPIVSSVLGSFARVSLFFYLALLENSDFWIPAFDPYSSVDPSWFFCRFLSKTGPPTRQAEVEMLATHVLVLLGSVLGA